jgi:hypothetical protein
MDYASSIRATTLVIATQEQGENIIRVKNLVSGQEVKGKVIQLIELVSEILLSSN